MKQIPIIKQYELPEGILSYINVGKTNEADNGLCITAYEGISGKLLIPARIDGYPVKAIGKKAFLGNRHLCHIILPDTIEAVGDWAFSRCHMLQGITVPKREICFGRQVFQKSGRLQEISIAGEDGETAKLLAAAVTTLEAEYLLSPLQAGSDNWYQSLDARILTLLEEPEEGALRNLVYCAEEDMGAKQESCLRKQAHCKANIAFLRLTCPEGMTHAVYQRLRDYLRQRTKGCQDESAWEVVKESRKCQLQYCDKLYEIGGIHGENLDAALNDLKEDNVELKAYLLKKWQGRQQASDLWEMLRLD